MQLNFDIYTMQLLCQWLRRLIYGDCVSVCVALGQDSEQERLISSLQDLGLRGRSAFEVYHSLPPATKGDGDKAKSKGSKPGKKGKGGKADRVDANEEAVNPVKSLQAVAKKLGLSSLSARWETERTLGQNHYISFPFNPFLSLLPGSLDGVKYENGIVKVINKKTGHKPKFYQKKWWAPTSLLICLQVMNMQILWFGSVSASAQLVPVWCYSEIWRWERVSLSQKCPLCKTRYRGWVYSVRCY